MAQRNFQVDAIKAVSILGVVMAHCMRPHWHPGASHPEVWYGAVLSIIVVPAFLFCAGFLGGRDRDSGPIGWSETLARYRRILGPYLIATGAAELFRIYYLKEEIHLWQDLLFANAFGPYYFVFHMVLLTALGPALSRLSRRGLVWLTLLFVVAGTVRSWRLWVLETGLDLETGFLLLVRNPFIYWGYYLVGWYYRVNQVAMGEWMHRRRGLLVPAAMFLIGAASVEGWLTPAGVTPWLSSPMIYATLFMLLRLPTPSGPMAGRVRWLSEHTYSFYLWHLFFVMLAMRELPAPDKSLSVPHVALHFGAGILGSLLIIGLSQAGASLLRRRTTSPG